jgi:hypothetical protein
VILPALAAQNLPHGLGSEMEKDGTTLWPQESSARRAGTILPACEWLDNQLREKDMSEVRD